MEMRVCETIPSRRLGDLCPKGGSQTLHSRFDHAEGWLELNRLRAGSATRKRESRQESDRSRPRERRSPARGPR